MKMKRFKSILPSIIGLIGLLIYNTGIVDNSIPFSVMLLHTIYMSCLCIGLILGTITFHLPVKDVKKLMRNRFDELINDLEEAFSKKLKIFSVISTILYFFAFVMYIKHGWIYSALVLVFVYGVSHLFTKPACKSFLEKYNDGSWEYE